MIADKVLQLYDAILLFLCTKDYGLFFLLETPEARISTKLSIIISIIMIIM